MSNARILLHPNIPKPLHGIAPRVIAGKDWWDIKRRKAYKVAGFCCEACGVARREAAYHQWLEAHEMYDYDYLHGRLTFVRLVSLCHACHNFIHCGRMEMMVQEGSMTVGKHNDIITHGMKILTDAGLIKEWEKRHQVESRVFWRDWRMVFEGKEYGPSTQSMEEWITGKWREWSPQS